MKNNEIDDLVALIDKMVADGTGHINIKTNDQSDEIIVDTCNSTDCSDGACKQPTEINIEGDK